MLDTQKILADNLTALLERRPDISRLNLSKQIKVSDGTLGRIKYGNGNPTVDVLERIGKFFKVEPWRLLMPNLGEQIVPTRKESPPPPTPTEEKSGTGDPAGLDGLIAKAVQNAVKEVLDEHLSWGPGQQKAG
ncbi:helix-turn-helix domain-containing protein [Burkholderia anthina]|uniref:helix-turn-helix domain-containing protein n=1 Tax=Burkholderia anthina TaxID=179879 RepID=UPI001AA0A738|nr:helix-turn-helix domain-containing protein [Burkholderia anthina]QTD88902.1 helix-turn-helix transcriptional regulator [Burkholderia anthina]